MTENNTQDTSFEITPSLIRDILGLRTSDGFGIFEAFASAVEGPNLQDTVDTLIQDLNEELSKDISTYGDLGSGLIDSAMINSARTVREAIVSLGTSFGTRQKEELSAYFNLLTTVDLSRAQKYVNVDMYDKRLYDFLKNIDGFDDANKANLFRASKVISMSDFQAPQTFDIGNNIRRAMFGSSQETANLGISTTAIRNFPTDLIGVIQRNIDNAPNQDPIDVFNAFLSDFGIGQLNDLMAPFISLSSITMKSTEQQAFLDFYNGEIEIKLHDIKMMPIVQAIFEPNRVLARITFGWTHPDKNTITGALMNLKNTIDVTIANYSISFDNDMSATITLNFISNAIENINRQTLLRNNAPMGVITNRSGIRDRVARLERLLGDIKRNKETVLERVGPASENSNVRTAMEASTSVNSFLALIFNEEDEFEPDSINPSSLSIEGGGVPTGSVAATIGKINEALSIATTISQDYLSLANEIIEEIWRNGSVAALRRRAEEELDIPLQRLTRIWSFPEQASAQDRLQSIQRALGQSRGADGFESEYAPLSEILNQFFFSPLYEGNPDGLSQGSGAASITGADASTVIYFRSNGSCGLFSNNPIGTFLIKKSVFQEKLENYMKQTGKIDITITDMMQTILSDLFSQKDDVNYGFGAFLNQELNLQDNAKTFEGVASVLSGLELDDAVKYALLSQFSFDGSERTSAINLKTINPKIIAIDKRAFSSYNKFIEETINTDPFLNNAELQDQPSEKIFIIYDDNDNDSVRQRIENEILNNFSLEISTDTSLTSEQKIKIKKSMARRLYPTLHVRKNETSIIESISARIGGGDSNLETILFTQQDYSTHGGLFQLPGTDATNPDVNFGNPFYFSRMPEVTVTTLGLPRLQLHQYIFLDFGSDTNLDNIYNILPNGLTHKIDASGFTTSFELQVTDAFGANELRARQNNNQSLDEIDETARGNRPTNQQESAVEEFDSSTFSTLQFVTLGYIGDNIRFSPERARGLMTQSPGGATWSTLQYVTLGYLGDNIRIGDRVGEDEPLYGDRTQGNTNEEQ